MTNDGSRLELTRRKILAGAGAVGLAGAGAGLGTSAYFSDQETFANNQLVAGELDLKVAVSQHYVDWLADTDTANGNESPSDPQETDDAEMPASSGDTDLVLEAGGVGGSDTVAQDIELDITDVAGLAKGSLVNTIHGGVPADGVFGGDSSEEYPEDSLCNLDNAGGDDDVDRAIVQLEDVKPGDFGFIRFAAAACDNPAFAWLTADIEDANENGTTEPEEEDPDEQAGVVELLDVVQTAVLDTDVADLLSASSATTVSPEQSLRGLASTRAPISGDIPAPEGGGAEGARDCFSALTNHRATLVWWVPIDHGNEIQSDSVTFSLGMEVEQCRHNDGSGIGDLVAYYPLDSVEDGTAEDLSGQSNNGTVNGVSSVDGKVGDAGSFDGTDDYVQIADDPSLGVTNVTVSAWVYRDGSKNKVYVVDGRDHNYGIKFDDGTSTPRFFAIINGSGFTLNANSGDIPDKTWTHVAGTYDGSTMTVYVNGTDEGTKSESGTIDVSNGPARIGDYIGGGYKFQGWIDDVRIYDRALSDSEIANLASL